MVDDLFRVHHQSLTIVDQSSIVTINHQSCPSIINHQSPIRPKNHYFGGPGAVLGRFNLPWGCLGASWGDFGSP